MKTCKAMFVGVIVGMMTWPLVLAFAAFWPAVAASILINERD